MRRTATILALTSLFVGSLYSRTVNAGPGDCGRPVSSGDTPTASDALYTLQAAVGFVECDACTCDVTDDDATTATDALTVLRTAVGQPVGLFCRPLCFDFVCDPENDEDNDGLNDCQEAEQLGTNPFVEDTDGDGLTDGQEIFEFAFDPQQNPALFNPRVADVPQLSFELTSAPEINVIGNLTNGTSYESGTRDLTGSERTYSTSKTDTETHRTEMTMSAELNFQNVVKKMIPPKSASPARIVTDTLGGALGFSHTTSDETSVSHTESSSNAMRSERETTQTEIVDMAVENVEGKIEILADITNAGHQTFGVSEFGLSVLKRDPIDRTTFAPVAQLGKAVFNRNDDGDFPTMAPGQSIADQIFTSDTGADIVEVTAQEALDLLEDPSGLVVTVSAFELEVVVNRGAGMEPVRIPWSANEQLVQQKTAAVIVDYGPPPFPAQERFLVSTNVHFNGDINSIPTPLGISVREVLVDILGFEYETEVLEVQDAETDVVTDRVRRLVSLTRPNGQGTFVADESINSSWSVWTDASSVEVFDNTTFSSTMDPFHDFEEIILRKTNKLHLVYREDRDGDGMGRREEFLYGTDDMDPDTDDDLVEDFVEARGGWSIEVVGADPYQGFANPIVVDTDGDGLTDGEEMLAGTDAQEIDTDADAETDFQEVEFGSDPLDPNDPPFPLDAVVQFNFNDGFATPGVVPDSSGNGNDGAKATGGSASGNVTSATDRFGVNEKAAEFIREPSDSGIIDLGARPEIDGPLTVAMWLDDHSSTGTLVSQRGAIGEGERFLIELDGPNLGVELDDPTNPGSRLIFSFSRSASNPWYHIALVFDYDAMADETTILFYFNGLLVEEDTVTFDGKFDNDPALKELTIGGRISCDTNPASTCYCEKFLNLTDCTNSVASLGYDGLMDDFRLYARALSPAEIFDLFNETD